MAINLRALGITPELPISEWERTAALPRTDENGESIQDSNMTLAEISQESEFDVARSRERACQYREKLRQKGDDQRTTYQRWLDIL